MDASNQHQSPIALPLQLAPPIPTQQERGRASLDFMAYRKMFSMPGVKPARSQVTLTSALSCLPANSLNYIKLNIAIFLITSHSPSTRLRAKRYRL